MVSGRRWVIRTCRRKNEVILSPYGSLRVQKLAIGEPEVSRNGQKPVTNIFRGYMRSTDPVNIAHRFKIIYQVTLAGLLDF